MRSRKPRIPSWTSLSSPVGTPEGTVTAITFGTVGPADGLGAVPVCCEEFNQVEHPLIGDAVLGVAIHPWGGGPGIGVDFLIRLHPQVRCFHEAEQTVDTFA